MTLPVWIGIGVCISQSAMFSGLNLAFFSLSKLRLEVEAAKGSRHASRALALRQRSNFLLTTTLWGNVAVNVLLALLSGSVLSGVAAFLFSTVLITFVGEIVPHAYFSRNALRMASLLSPVLRFYQVLLFPVARTTALILDKWLGPEGIPYFKEQDLKELIRRHADSFQSDVGRVEAIGALNFLEMDDLLVVESGQPADPGSIVSLEFQEGRPVFPSIGDSPSDEFLQSIYSAERKWIVVVDADGRRELVLDSDSLIRDAAFGKKPFNPYLHCHRPVVVESRLVRLGGVVPGLNVHPVRRDDGVLRDDIILFWGDEKRIITGTDILEILLRGVVRNEDVCFEESDGK